jgi:hypothetical protein
VSTKTKRSLFQITSLLGDSLGLLAYFGLGYYAHIGVTAKLLNCMCLFVIGTGVKVIANASDRALWKMRVEPPKTGDPYRDAQTAVYSRIAELEAELAAEKKTGEAKRPFPFEYVMGGFCAALLVLLLIGAVVSSCSKEHSTAPKQTSAAS